MTPLAAPRLRRDHSYSNRGDKEDAEGGQRDQTGDTTAAKTIIGSAGVLGRSRISESANVADFTINARPGWEDEQLGASLSIEAAAQATRDFIESQSEDLVDIDLGPDW